MVFLEILESINYAGFCSDSHNLLLITHSGYLVIPYNLQASPETNTGYYLNTSGVIQPLKQVKKLGKELHNNINALFNRGYNRIKQMHINWNNIVSLFAYYY